MATPKKTGVANTDAKRGKGKPFEKGNSIGKQFTANDPRANRNGQRAAPVVRFGKEIRAVIVEVGEEQTTLSDGRVISKIEGVVRAAYKQAIAGDSAARLFLVERVEGKVTQPVKHEFDDLSDEEVIKRSAELVARIASGIAGIAETDDGARTD